MQLPYLREKRPHSNQRPLSKKSSPPGPWYQPGAPPPPSSLSLLVEIGSKPESVKTAESVQVDGS